MKNMGLCLYIIKIQSWPWFEYNYNLQPQTSGQQVSSSQSLNARAIGSSRTKSAKSRWMMMFFIPLKIWSRKGGGSLRLPFPTVRIICVTSFGFWQLLTLAFISNFLNLAYCLWSNRKGLVVYLFDSLVAVHKLCHTTRGEMGQILVLIIMGSSVGSINFKQSRRSKNQLNFFLIEFGFNLRLGMEALLKNSITFKYSWLPGNLQDCKHMHTHTQSQPNL